VSTPRPSLGRLRAAVGVLLCAAALGCRAKPREPAETPGGSPSGQSPLPAETAQLVIGITADWDATAVELRLFERAADGAWTQTDAPWPGRVGRSGLAWGRGLHGNGAPEGIDGPVKREGDGRAPAGLFAIGRAYGYDAAPPAGCRAPYAQLTDTWQCVDDPASAFYNRVLDTTGRDRDWSSAETMRRDDDLYRWVVEIDHNHGASQADAPGGRPEPGAGSCIFFHVWADADSPTAGCTAMALNDIEGLLTALEPEKQPVYGAFPGPVYRRLARAWALPNL